jgi:MFS family permease
VSSRLGGLRSPKEPLGQKDSYRWVVLAMGFLAVFGALGFGRFGYSAILPAMQKDLGISSAAAGSLASWNLAGYMVMAALGGLLASRFGARLVVGIGSFVAAGGMVLTGLSNNITTAAAARLLTGLGGGAVLVPSVALMSSWFGARQRGMASAIVSSGSSLALVITGPVVPAIIAAGGIDGDGWRMAWYFFAALTCVVGVLTLVLQRNRQLKAPHFLAIQGSIWRAQPLKVAADTPGDAAMEAALSAWSKRGTGKKRAPLDVLSVLRSPYAWHLGFVYMAFGFAYMIFFTFFQKRLTVDIGLSSATAGNYFLVLGVASLACGFIWGTISDRVGRSRAIAVNLALQAVAAVLFAVWPSTVGIVLSALLFGITTVAIPGIVGAGCGDMFGMRLASTSLGFVTIFLGIGQVLGPYVAGRMEDAFQTLKYSYLLAAGVFFVGAVLSILMRGTGGAEKIDTGGRLGVSGETGGTK